MNPKAVFLEDKELVRWWVNVAHDSRFEKVSALAMASLATHNPADVLGALSFINTLSTFTDPDISSVPFPSPGLVHETPKRKTETEKPKA